MLHSIKQKDNAVADKKKTKAKTVASKAKVASKKAVSTVTKKAANESSPTKVVEKPAAKKPAVKKVAAKKAPAGKAAVKKVVAKKSTAKKTVKKAAKPVAKNAAKKPATQKTKPAIKAPAIDTAALINIPQFPQNDTINDFIKEALMSQPNFQFDKIAQEAANTSRENVEALLKSSSIFAKGFETLLKTAASMSQSAAEKQAQYAKEIMASKSLNEAAEAQNKIAQANFDEFMAGATKISEMSVKLLNDASAPLNEQVTKSVQKATKMAA